MFVYSAFENIGIEYLSAVLNQHGFETRLAFDPRLFSDQFIKIKYLDRVFNYESLLLSKIKDYNPSLIVFSVISADYSWALSLARKIKNFTSSHITFGGIHPSSAPEEVISHDCVDSVILGEGEFALLELAESIKNNQSDQSIRNVWFKENGGIVKNHLRPFIEDLDFLPFPDKELYYREIPGYRTGYTIITRRGCVNNCSYCHNTVWQKLYPNGKRIRIRSVGNVLEELRQAKRKYNFKLLRVNDDLFTSDKNWLKEFARQYKQEIRIPLYCFGSPSTVDEEVIGYLKDCGCYHLCLGVQSVNSKVNNEIFHRYEPIERIRQAVELCRKYKIRAVVDNIIGFPSQEESHFLEIAQFYSNNKVDRICVFWLVYYPGTDIVTIAKDRGVLNEEDIINITAQPFESANTLYNKVHCEKSQKFCLFLELYHFLPQPVFRWMLKHRLYRFLPKINPAIVAYFYTLFAKDRLDIPRRRYYIRYARYIPEVLFWKAKNKIK